MEQQGYQNVDPDDVVAHAVTGPPVVDDVHRPPGSSVRIETVEDDVEAHVQPSDLDDPQAHRQEF